MAKSTTGGSISVRRGGASVSGQWSLADIIAAAAIPTGLIIANLDSPLPGPADVVGIPITLAGLAYFGVKAATS